MNSVSKKNLENEIAALECIHHENIVRLEEVIETDNYIFIVQEYCNGGDLETFIDFNG